MDKKIFNNISYMISKELSRNSLTELCDYYGCTTDEFEEYIYELALIGFKDKYNQHNHPENNKGV